MEESKNNTLECLETLEELILESENPEDFQTIREELLTIIDGLDDQCFFDPKIQRKINQIIIDNRDKLGINNIEKVILGLEEEDDLSFELKPIQLSNIVFVPTGKNQMQNGSGSFTEKQKIPRLKYAAEVLEDLKLKKVLTFEGIKDESMMRDEMYVLLVIPELNRSLLICEEDENITFVRDGIWDLPTFYASKKDDLKEREDVSTLKWYKDAEKWKAKLKKLLVEDFEEKSESKPVQNRINVKREDNELDKDYFKDDKNIEKDLWAFAEAAKVDSPAQLTTRLMRANDVECSNKKTVNGRNYLYAAGRNFLNMSESKAGSRQKKVLDELLIRGGFIKRIEFKRDEKYFKNVAYVRADLQSFVNKIEGIDSIKELNFHKMGDVTIVCSNGEEVNGYRYMYAVMREALKKGRKESINSRSVALEYLKVLVGELGYLRDENYYQKKEMMKQDLDSFAEQLEIESPYLIVTQMMRERLLCHSGEDVTIRAYIYRYAKCIHEMTSGQAEKVLIQLWNEILEKAGYTQKNEYVQEIKERLAKKKREKEEEERMKAILKAVEEESAPKTKKKTLKKKRKIQYKKLSDNAKRRQEIELLNEDYFGDKESLRADLWKFVEVIDDKNVQNPAYLINAWFGNKTIVASNGITYRGDNFLTRIGKIFFGLKAEQVEKNRSKCIRKLIELAGFEAVEIEKMDAEYFNNPENLRHDFEAAVAEWGKEGKTPADLGPRVMSSIAISCSNGEKMNARTFAHRAGKILYGWKYSKSRKFETLLLKRLLHKAGFLPDFEDYEPMEKEYFNDSEAIRNDLLEILKQYPEGYSNLEEIRISYITSTMSFRASNGEYLRAQTYLSRYGKMVKKLGSKKCIKHYKEIFVELIKKANLEDLEKETDEEILRIRENVLVLKSLVYLDQNYFVQENLEKDFWRFVKAIGKNLDDPKDIDLEDFMEAEIIATNGEKYTGANFIIRAGRVFYDWNDVSSIRCAEPIMQKLLFIAGFLDKFEDVEEMDEEYFRNPEIVKQDLIALARCHANTRFKDKILPFKSLNTPFRASNNEILRFQVYLRRYASISYNYTMPETQQNFTSLVTELQEFAGIDDISAVI